MSSPHPPKYKAVLPPELSSNMRPEPNPIQGQPNIAENSNTTLRPEAAATPAYKKKRNNHRGGKKRRNRRQSFAAPSDNGSAMGEISQARRNDGNAARDSFYIQHGRILSNTSLESEALLDHRDQSSMRPRRSSIMAQNVFNSSYRQSYAPSNAVGETPSRRRPRTARSGNSSGEEIGDERTPLIAPAFSRAKNSQNAMQGYGTYGGDSPGDTRHPSNHGRNSSRSSRNSKRRTIFDKTPSGPPAEEYNVNYPPSVPGSPHMGAMGSQMSFGPDMMIRDDFDPPRGSSHGDLDHLDCNSLHEHAIDDRNSAGSPHRPRLNSSHDLRRHTIAMNPEEDVCFPLEGMSEISLDDQMARRNQGSFGRGGEPRRRRTKKWPDLDVLDDWNKFEKEGRSEEIRAKRMTEPQLIGGRLRPIHKGWHRAEDDAPYRFTYFNEEFESTIHSQTISELVQPGGSFRELFVPEPRVLSDSSSDEDDGPDDAFLRHTPGENGHSRAPTRQGSVIDRPESRRSTLQEEHINSSREHSGQGSPFAHKSPDKSQGTEKPKRYGERPTWWLDVLSPTDAEMKVLSKTFGIHPLTAEDIMMQEAREKVELFRNYYFVNYRSFEQDMNNEDFLEPVNMYVVVFREGVISFHFSMTPHPANVRRRIRQLKDYLILSSDWISYAIIDDITDVFAPLIQNIEDEVDDIDDAILMLHTGSQDGGRDNKKDSENGDGTSGESGGDMLRRVGDCRKKVMGLYRLLGNKADVIKGFAKRCNEHWEVAPRSEIGLYLGDIQDHIVTMTGNLSHYEKILARSHGNYLAQINIRMNERQEQTADVLGRLTVLGTIVLPMNIITGLWGMNVWVPGQDNDGDLTWFAGITAGLVVFGLGCFYVAKLLYRIV